MPGDLQSSDATDIRLEMVKSCEQQGVLALRRARQGFVIARTAQANQIRGPRWPCKGTVIPQGISHITATCRDAGTWQLRCPSSSVRCSPG